MQRGAVAFVLIEGVTRVEFVIKVHQTIAKHLGHDRSAADHVVALVSVHDGSAWHGNGWNHGSIHEDEVGRSGEVENRLLHGEERGAKNVASVDLFGADDPKTHLRMGANDIEGVCALARREPLGIVNADWKRSAVEDHRRSDNRTGPRAAPGFIHTGNAVQTLR